MVTSFHNALRRPTLPKYASAVQEKLSHRRFSRYVHFSFPIPGARHRRLRVVLPNVAHLYSSTAATCGRKLASLLFLLAFFSLAFVAFALTKRFGTRAKKWPCIVDPSTLIFGNNDLRRIWEWEIASGHYPSRRSIPEQLRFLQPPLNPGIPPEPNTSQNRLGTYANSTRGVGTMRTYLNNKSRPPNVAYPPRPVPGTVADMDVVMDHCDFSKNKYVRDCLEVLRISAGLDTANIFRKAIPDAWRYIYKEEATFYHGYRREADEDSSSGATDENEKAPFLSLPPPRNQHLPALFSSPCDPDYPRIFHMFWTGPFTDKPYTSLLSFLYTQNAGLHLRIPPANVCRPQIWMWINPGPAASLPNSNALRDMFDQLKQNPWASPFLHPRFKDVIAFKLWNTTEQLDSIPELRDEWRKRDLFNSGGHVIRVSPKAQGEGGISWLKTSVDDLQNRAGSKSSSTYDRLSVILSDMARFILCHRFGGVYLDADTLFLRDWEELWGWKGAFAYRWSRLPRYNTAVLHLNKGSALGSFLFHTALKNGLDFHPITISRYTKDAHLDELLLRLPDALFDPAWLNTENYQRNRPAQPYFTDFADFFETPAMHSAAPQALGIDGFFKGAFSYHFHNFWWKPFDPDRNWPDLGTRFASGERIARAAMKNSSFASITADREMSDDFDFEDQRDLSWATVFKRTFEAYIRGERPNLYGEWIQW